MPDLWVSDCSGDTVSSSPQDEEAKGRPAGTRQCPLGLCSPSPFLPGSGRPSNGSPPALPAHAAISQAGGCSLRAESPLPPLSPLNFSTPAACDELLTGGGRPDARPKTCSRTRSERGLVPRCKETGPHKLTKIKCLVVTDVPRSPFVPAQAHRQKFLEGRGTGRENLFPKRFPSPQAFPPKQKNPRRIPGTIKITCRARNLS